MRESVKMILALKEGEGKGIYKVKEEIAKKAEEEKEAQAKEN